jgi:lysophospholipase L1-like esterase
MIKVPQIGPLLTDENSIEEKLIPVGDTPFGNDPYLGRTLKPGQDFIGANGFISFTDAIAEIKANKKPIVLNIGDSSTSGWDTQVTIENQERKANNQPLLSAFFRYPNYSDLLRKQLGNEYTILNAGIPGHTSINGRRRLKQLLNQFQSNGITADYVSIYYGNNDCQWEFNVEDKAKLRSSRLTPLFIDRLRLKMQQPDTKHIRLRTNKRDFAYNIRNMLSICINHGAAPMLILPEVPLYWEPGKRFVRENFPVNETMPGGKMVLAALARSLQLWNLVIDEPWSEEKHTSLEAAREMDFVIPRIKKVYREALETTAREMGIPLVRTSFPKEENDGEYYVDYCHPIGAANVAIAGEIAKTLEGYQNGRIGNNIGKTPLIYRILDSPFIDLVASRLAGSGKKSTDEDPTNKDIYTLY